VAQNNISFDPGESIAITGGIELKLADIVRKLVAEDGPTADKKASYEVKEDLARDMISEQDAIANPAAFVESLGFASFLPVIAYALW